MGLTYMDDVFCWELSSQEQAQIEADILSGKGVKALVWCWPVWFAEPTALTDVDAS